MTANSQIRIVARRNGVGLDRDVALIQGVLPSTANSEVHAVRSLVPLSDRVPFLLSDRADASPTNLLIERVPYAWTFARGAKLLIPNQERFPKRHLARLQNIDVVLCKSRHAEQIFSQYAAPARYIGFTSVDRQLEEIQPDFSRFLHLAGRSTLKGTETILALWQAHPEWPTLTLIQHPDNAPSVVPPNVHLVVEYLDDTALRELQNQHGIHLCPSLSEGWGHYIVEGMSCGAVVITTDGPPMNELVDDTRGLVVPWHRSTPRHLGTNFLVDPQMLEATIIQVLKSPTEEHEQRGAAARQWFLENQLQFERLADEHFSPL